MSAADRRLLRIGIGLAALIEAAGIVALVARLLGH